jgi:transposase
MKKKEDYVGIDISKEKIDVRLFNEKKDSCFLNTVSGFKKMIDWINKLVGEDASLVFCFEHTGVYSVPLHLFLDKENLLYILVSGLQVKRSLGIQRGKNDRVDSKRLAEYVYLFRESITPQKLQTPLLVRIKYLLSLRARLIKQRAGYKASVPEYKKYLALGNLDIIIRSQNKMIEVMTTQIKAIDKEIHTVIGSDVKIHEQYLLATSVKGIGQITAAYMIVLTNCFTEFKTWRKFACYAGSAPFELQSGTSIKGKTKISHYANKQIKAILTNAVKSAVQHSPELKKYYQRRINEGKHKKIVVNILRNKLISRVFATVRRGTPYVEISNYAA